MQGKGKGQGYSSSSVRNGSTSEPSEHGYRHRRPCTRGQTLLGRVVLAQMRYNRNRCPS